MRNKLIRLSLCSFAAVIALALLGSQPAAAGSTLLATTGNGATGPSTLLEIDPVTGATLQTIGPVGFFVNGLEFDPATGKLYGSTSVRDPNYNGLIEIDMNTGAGTPVGVHQWGGIPTAPINCVPSAVTNITIDSGGQMYGWLDPCDDDLVRIDKNTGIATWVGLSGVGTAANGLDFDASDTLYMIQFGSVWQVNVATGLAGFIGSYASGGCCVHHGDFDLATDLYYAIGPNPGGSGPKFLEVLDVSSLTVVNTVPLEDAIHVLTFVDRVIEVDIDIKFCSDPNGFNCKSKGVTPVTIFGTDDFDVDDIVIGSLRLCLADLSLCTTSGPKSWSVADRGGPGDVGAEQCAIDPLTGEELDWLNQDGFDDLDAAFRTQEVVDVIGCDGLEKGDTSPTLVLIGETTDGTPITSIPVGDDGIDQLLIQKN